jgi:hypothetical protein
VFYKNFGDEQTRTLAFIKNQYDVDTFMSPDNIDAAKKQYPDVATFAKTLPYHDMNDACSYGIIFNQQKAPLDKAEGRSDAGYADQPAGVLRTDATVAQGSQAFRWIPALQPQLGYRDGGEADRDGPGRISAADWRRRDAELRPRQVEI